eukprot:c18617_g1_i1.p1 GENE.c18617_g1_i1~~c18617_g1_i1.p1  ORF type:complete len:234 (+),score=78.61 c18617_g1_i1:32-733(+)
MSEQTKPKIKVAVLGGSFDPITNAHLNVASEIVHSRLVDQVWIVPCGPRPDKPSLKTSVMDRYIMCQLSVESVFSHNFGVQVSDIEVGLPRALGTLSLMRKLGSTYPHMEFYFVIGEDLIEQLPEWDDVDYVEDPKGAGRVLMKTEKFLVMERPGFKSDKELENNFIRLSLPHDATIVSTLLSSSEIRKRVQHGYQRVQKNANQHDAYHGVEGLLPAPVVSYMKRYKLYIPSS